MADEVNNFNVFDDKGTKVVDSKPSPIQLSGLTPNTKYTGWTIARVGQTASTAIPDFTTLPRPLASFKIDNLSPKGDVGTSVKLTASGFAPSGATNKGIQMGVEDSTVASVVDNKDNTYTVNFLKVGTTKIHWVASDGNGAKADATVTVTKPAQA